MANSSAIKAGRAFVELFADDSKLVSGLKRAKARLSAFGAGIGVMGGRLMGAGAAAAVPFGLGAREFAAFETQMSNIATLLDEPAKHMMASPRASSGWRWRPARRPPRWPRASTT